MQQQSHDKTEYTDTKATVNDKFDFGRLMFLIHRRFTYDKRLILIGAGAFFGILCTIAVLNGLIAKPDADTNMANTFFASNGSAIFMLYTVYILTGAFLSITASLAFSEYGDRRTRLAAMVVPATKAEKFVAALSINVIVATVFAVCADMAAELIRKAFLPAGYMWMWQSDLVDVISENGGDDIIILTVVSFIVTIFTAQALFVLGSTMWPKLSFVKTLLASWLLSIVGSIVIMIASNQIDSFKSQMILQISLYAIVAIAAYILSWIRFDRTVLVQRFMK